MLNYKDATAGTSECENAISTREMLECQNAQLKNATQELSELYKRLEKSLDAKQQKTLKDAHAAWLTYRNSHCVSAASVYEPGSLAGVVRLTCSVDLTKERIRELRMAFKDVLEPATK
jgi:uncharacterized protein YecT (DUF1311 family)